MGGTYKRSDPVNHPPHYGQGKIECIDYIEDFLTKEEFIGYLRGNIAKYLHRWRYKNQEEDLYKAQWYLSKLTYVIEKDKTHETEDYGTNTWDDDPWLDGDG